jgi:hypothetical protein
MVAVAIPSSSGTGLSQEGRLNRKDRQGTSCSLSFLPELERLPGFARIIRRAAAKRMS